GMGESAVFELFVRSLPPTRGFLLAAGLEQALDYLATLRFTGEELEWLAREGRFERAFVDYLARLRFTGDVHALPEGTVFFADEPILRVTAPLPEAQLVESRLLHLLHFQTLVASKAARLDSGDLAEHARRVRRILDAGELREVTIFASGNLDEDALRELLASGAPIDGFGLGTRLVTSADAPYLDCAYKLVEYAGRPRRKRSEGKASWPGRKQVWRRHGDDGRMREDVLALADDPQAGTALLVPVMRAGRRVGLSPSLAASRAHADAELGRLPEVLRRLEPGGERPRLGRAHARRLRLRREGVRRAHAASARARPSGPGPPARAPAGAASQAERVRKPAAGGGARRALAALSRRARAAPRRGEARLRPLPDAEVVHALAR